MLKGNYFFRTNSTPVEILNDMLAAGADVNANNYKGQICLMYTAQQGRYEASKLLIEKKADMNRKDNYGWTPLYYASWYNKTDIVNLLLENGAIDERKQIKLNKKFLTVCDSENADIKKELQRLLKAGAEIETTDLGGSTCLMKTIGKGKYEASKLLIEKEADVNRENRHGWTAMHDVKFSSQRNNTKIAKLLTDNGANPNVHIPIILY